MLDQVRFEAFESLVGQTLRLSSGPDYLDLELIKARRLQNPSPRAESPFAIELRENGVNRTIGQGVYRLHHPTLGDMDLFVVPLGPDGSGVCYEITFN